MIQKRACWVELNSSENTAPFLHIIIIIIIIIIIYLYDKL